MNTAGASSQGARTLDDSCADSLMRRAMAFARPGSIQDVTLRRHWLDHHVLGRPLDDRRPESRALDDRRPESRRLESRRLGPRRPAGSLPAGRRPAGRVLGRRRSGLVAASIVIVVAVSGCGAATNVPSITAGQSAASPTSTVASPSTEPVATDPGATPLETPSASVAPSSPAPGGAGCTGSVGNRDFFASVAASVEWTVYCAVLPDGWYIESGNYRLRSQGQMRVAYRGPNGAHLVLSEGAFCTDANGCVPNGQATGSAMFGDVEGTSYVLDGGGLAIVVDQGAVISWLAIGGNLDQPTFQALVAELHRVD